MPKEKLAIKKINTIENDRIELMANGHKFIRKVVAENLEIDIPEYDPNLPLENNYAYGL